MTDIILPKAKDGKFYVSYSQLNLFNEARSYNLRKEGYIEYIQKYFFGRQFADEHGFGGYGTKVEQAIESQDFTDFSDKEKKVLKKIEPLEVWQKELFTDFGGFRVLAYIDNCTSNLKHIRDYKTASNNSRKKYYKPDYKQLDLYSLCVKKEEGFVPDKAEITIIERKGNPFRPSSFEGFKIGENVWEEELDISQKRLDEVEEWVYSTVKEISKLYKTYLKYNKKFALG